jgi:predicted PurR-regulated permease PerM
VEKSISYSQRVLITLALVCVVLAAGLLLRSAAGAFLLIFTGLLFGVFLRTLAGAVGQLTQLPPRGALALATILLLALMTALGMIVVPRVAEQADSLVQGLPEAVGELEAWLAQYSWGESLMQRSPLMGEGDLPTFDVLSRLTGTFSSLFTLLTNAVFIIFIGLFTAANPASYRDGIVGLLPPARRQRARTVLARVWSTLQGWLLGKLLTMFLVTILTGVGLMILGMPFALTLALLAGVFELVPFIGPILAAIPALLLTFAESPGRVFQIALLYLVIQQVEGNLITPLIYKRTVALPPVLTLAAILVMGTLFGFLELFVAAPLLAVAIVLVKLLYQQDVLGDPPDEE